MSKEKVINDMLKCLNGSDFSYSIDNGKTIKTYNAQGVVIKTVKKPTFSPLAYFLWALVIGLSIPTYINDQAIAAILGFIVLIGVGAASAYQDSRHNKITGYEWFAISILALMLVSILSLAVTL